MKKIFRKTDNTNLIVMNGPQEFNVNECAIVAKLRFCLNYTIKMQDGKMILTFLNTVNSSQSLARGNAEKITKKKLQKKVGNMVPNWFSSSKFFKYLLSQ